VSECGLGVSPSGAPRVARESLGIPMPSGMGIPKHRYLGALLNLGMKDGGTGGLGDWETGRFQSCTKRKIIPRISNAELSAYAKNLYGHQLSVRGL
jgi:hypothetical protein